MRFTDIIIYISGLKLDPGTQAATFSFKNWHHSFSALFFICGDASPYRGDFKHSLKYNFTEPWKYPGWLEAASRKLISPLRLTHAATLFRSRRKLTTDGRNMCCVSNILEKTVAFQVRSVCSHDSSSKHFQSGSNHINFRRYPDDAQLHLTLCAAFRLHESERS